MSFWLKVLVFWFALALVTAPLIGRWLKRNARAGSGRVLRGRQ